MHLWVITGTYFTELESIQISVLKCSYLLENWQITNVVCCKIARDMFCKNSYLHHIMRGLSPSTRVGMGRGTFLCLLLGTVANRKIPVQRMALWIASIQLQLVLPTRMATKHTMMKTARLSWPLPTATTARFIMAKWWADIPNALLGGTDSSKAERDKNRERVEGVSTSWTQRAIKVSLEGIWLDFFFFSSTCVATDTTTWMI